LKEFIHLHNHSHYSLLDAISTIDGLINAAVEDNMKAVALTDHGVMYGALEFYKKAKAKGIKPIIGCEVYVAQSGTRHERGRKDTDVEASTESSDGLASTNINYAHLILLAKDEIGYRNLIKIVSIGHMEGYYYKPRVDLEVLRQYNKGLVATSACAGGVISCYITRGDMEMARKMTGNYKDIYGDDFYLELQDHGSIDAEKKVMREMPKLAKEFGIKLIATNDVHYIKREHAIAHNIYLNISAKQAKNSIPIDVINDLRYGTDQIYFKTSKEMTELFKDFPEAIQSTLEVTEKCNLELDLSKNHMPNFKIPAEEKKAKTLEEYLENLSREGLKKRVKEVTKEAEERLAYELGVINKMNFAGYFLIVMDIIKTAKEKGILVGPGRGSAAGSLVSYCIGITEVNPLEYDLLFERFLNPTRISMPDIDMDFQDDRRDELIQYAKEKYGEKSVAQVITFNKLAPRGVLKDVGRVLNFNFDEINNLTKHIPIVFGKVTSLKKSLEEVADFGFYFKNGTADEKKSRKRLFDYSSVLENLNKNSSLHASGVVIAPGDITDYVPLSKVTGEDSVFCTQYDMNQLEDAGLIKMDFLGLKELKVIGKTLELVNKKYNLDLTTEKIPLDDEKTYELFSAGATVGIFQFSKGKMRESLAKLKPKNINDLSAMNALYRPGPMKLIPEFIDKRFGRKPITYLHPLLENSLKSTYGIIVYQEQVMQIATDMAGFTMAQADNMRKAMGKKIKETMQKVKVEFIDGAVKNKVPKNIAEQIFNLIMDFADYGFNKSHGVAYSILAFYTAYLKAHFPIEFLAVSMLCRKDSDTEIQELAVEAKKMGIKLKPPSINEALVDFKIKYYDEEYEIAIENLEENKRKKKIGEIIYGLSALKNVGEKAAQNIITEREANGKYKGFIDFMKRVDLRIVNKKALESMILGGAFDELEPNRKKLFTHMERATAYAIHYKERPESKGQEGLFGGAEEEQKNEDYILDYCEDFSETEKFIREKDVVGFYLTGHPLDKYEKEIKNFTTLSFNADLTEINLNQINPVKMCGVIHDLQIKISKRGKKFAIFKLVDFFGKGECVAFPQTYEEKMNLFRENGLIVVEGKAEENGDEIKLVIDNIYSIDRLHEKNAANMQIILNKQFEPEKLDLIFEEINKHPGGSCRLFFTVVNNGSTKKYLSREIRVNPKQELISNLKNIVGETNLIIN
jgi:DNA polymerase-3 subunit alpha